MRWREKEVRGACIGKPLYLKLQIDKNTQSSASYGKPPPLQEVSSPSSLAPSSFLSGSFSSVKTERSSRSSFVCVLTGKTATTIAIIVLHPGFTSHNRDEDTTNPMTYLPTVQIRTPHRSLDGRCKQERNGFKADPTLLSGYPG